MSKFQGGSTVNKNVNVNVSINNMDQANALLRNFGEAIKHVMDGADYSPYLKDQLALIEDLKKAYADFERFQSGISANNLIRSFNAVKATGLEDLKSQFQGLDIEGAVDRASQKLTSLGDTASSLANRTVYAVETLANLRKGLDLLSAAGIKAPDFLQTLQTDAEAAKRQIEALEKRIEELERDLEFSDSTMLENLQEQLETIRSQFADTFKTFLLNANFDEDEIQRAFSGSYTYTQAGDRMKELFGEIREGSLTASEAIAQMGTEYAETIQKMSGQSAGTIASQFDTSAIQALEAKIDELDAKLVDLSLSAQNSGSAIQTAADDGTHSVEGVQQAVQTLDVSMLRDVFQLLNDIVNQSSELSESAGSAKNAASGILDTLSSIVNTDNSARLESFASALGSLKRIIDSFSSQGGGRITGLTTIANFVERVSSSADVAKLSVLSGIKLDGFKDVKASKTLNNLADFITKVSGPGSIPDLAPLITSLESISGITISRGFNGVSATLSELSKITTGKKFQNLQNLKLKDVFDMSGVEGNLTLFKELVSNAEKYADALQLISKYQGSVGKMAAGSSGTAIGTVVREIEAAKAELDKQLTDDAAIRSTTEVMWREYDQARSSVEKLGAAAKDAATPVKELSSSWVGSQSQQALADIERETDAYMELAAAEQQALEAKLAAAEQKEIAAWDKAADKEYAKEVADAFRDLERATKAYYDARVEQAKYTGTDQTVIRQLQEAVELTERQKVAAEQKAQAYRDDEAAAEAAASAEAKLAAIQSKMESKLSTMADKQAKSETSENEGFAQSMQRAWEVARNALQLYRKELDGTTNGPVQDLLRTLEELTAQFNEARGLNSFGEEDKQSYSGLTDTLSDVIEKLRIAREELSQVGGTTSSIEAAKSAMLSLNQTISSVISSSEAWKNALGADNQFSAQAEEILARLSGLAGEMERDGLSADDLRSRLQALKVEFSDLSIRAKDAMSNANFVQGTQAQADALDKVSKAITDLDTKMANMGSARNGKTAGNYQELVRLRAEYEILQKAIQSCSTSEDAFKTKMSQLSTEVRQNIAAIQMAGEATKTFGERILEVAGKLSSWISPMRIVMYVIRTFKQMVSTSIELDSAMAQLRVVTGASSAELEKFGNSAAKTAAQIGASIKDLIDSTTVFSRLGYSLSESSQLAKYTAMLKQVGDIDISDAQNAITAITKAFSDEIQIDDIESVMDRLVIVGKQDCPAA